MRVNGCDGVNHTHTDITLGLCGLSEPAKLPFLLLSKLSQSHPFGANMQRDSSRRVRTEQQQQEERARHGQCTATVQQLQCSYTTNTGLNIFYTY